MPATAVQTTIDSGQCLSGSICFELMKGAPAAVVALLAALIAGLIAYRQYRVAKAKLNLDLFERRYKIFEIVWGALSITAQSGIPNSKPVIELNNIVHQVSFLFGADIDEYVKLVHDKILESQRLRTKNGFNNNFALPEDRARLMELTNWLTDQAKRGVREQFGKYLNFQKWR